MDNNKNIIPLDNNEFKANSLEELKRIVESYFTEKGVKPNVIEGDDCVIVIIEENKYKKAVLDFQRAADLCNHGKFNQAKPILDTIIKECPSFSEAYRLKAQIVKMEGDIEKAIDINLDALCCDPNNGWALVLMGNLLMEQKDFNSAIGYFERVIKNDPHNFLAQTNAGMCLIKLEKNEEAIEYFKKALKEDETYPTIYYGFALAYSMLEKYDKAFEMAHQGMIKSIEKPENPGQKKQLQQLFIHIAQACVSVYNYSDILKDYQQKVQKKTNYPIVFEKDDTLGADAQMRMAQQHDSKEHVVVFKGNNKYKVHMVMHELTHLSMALDALNNGKLKTVMSGQMHYNRFMTRYEKFFTKIEKRIGEEETKKLSQQMYSGLVLLIMNAPLDMFVEDTLYEIKALRPMQLLSLIALEEKSIQGDAQGDEVFPLDFVNTVRTMNCATSIHLKKLYGIDMINRHKPSKATATMAQDLFDEYEAYHEGYDPGEEYDLVDYFADSVKCKNFFTLVDYVETAPKPSDEEIAERQEQFNAKHGEDRDPMVDMMMSMYMLDALRYFDSKLPSVAQQAAAQIAMIGTSGISPSQKSGYKVPAIPNEDFGGYRLLAYYYVSWAIAYPNMLKELNLPFDDAYQMAKQLFDAEKTNN